MKTKRLNQVICAVLTLVMLLGVLPATAFAAEETAPATPGTNPYLPSWEYFADGEPHVFFDPKTGEDRVYIYGSHDLSDTYGGGCLGDYMAWSAPVSDLTNWTCEGVLYDKTEDPNLRDEGKNILASDCCFKNGKYYLFYGGGVAISDNPGGPFKFYGRVHYADGTAISQSFDPAILVDDDGRNWLYTGGKSQVVELEDDMLTIKGGDVRLIPRADEMEAAIADPSLFPNVTNVADIQGFAFYEGSSIRKINGTYYLIWCNQKTHEYSYATAPKPTGPFTFRGVIISNAGIMKDEEGEKATFPWGNIHGGILELDGKYYIFYHRQSNGQGTRWWSGRQACAEPITINADGSIVRAEMTSQGLSGGPLDPLKTYDADIACYLCTPEGAKNSAEKIGPYILELDRDTHVITNTVNGSIAGYKYFDFGEDKDRALQLDLEIRGKAYAGTISVYADDPATGTKLGSVELKQSQSTNWRTVTVDLAAITGTHAVYLVFEVAPGRNVTPESTLCDLKSFTFKVAGADEPEDFRFDDVKDESKSYFDPVYWAYEADPQITNGLTDTTFGPDASCTRAQVVTFLWRAAGCPEPKNAKVDFTDLKPGDFYEKAVAWAVEKEITNGLSDTTFGPDATCTRGQIVTFLWRFAGKQEPENANTGFTDVADTEFYAKAVAWAVENEVTNGMTATTFGPDATCTRGQVVTFLYRVMA